MKKVLLLSFSGLMVILGNLFQYWIVARTIQAIFSKADEVPFLLMLLAASALCKAPFSFYAKAAIPAASENERLQARRALLSKVFGLAYEVPSFLKEKNKQKPAKSFQSTSDKKLTKTDQVKTQQTSSLDPVDLLTDGVESLELYRGLYLPQFILGMLSPLAVCAGIALVDLKSALILLAFVPLVPILTNVLKNAFKKASEKYRSETASLSARFQEGILGLRTLKLFGASQSWGRRVKEKAEGHRKASMKLLATNQLMILWTDLSFTATTLGVALFLAASRYQEGALDLGSALFLILASIELARPLQLMGAFFFAGGLAKASMKKMKGLLFTPETHFGENKSREPQEPRVSLATSIRSPIHEGELRVQNLSFSYNDPAGSRMENEQKQNRAILHKLDLTVKIGEALGLSGASGSGKTTLARILQGLENADSGSIEFAGQEGTIDLSHNLTLRQNYCATATQNPYLFSGTLDYNLRLAKPEAHDAEVLAALELAGLGDFVREERAGIYREIGEEGRRLSGGQRSRLSLARAILKNSPVLILDEPSADLDVETENKIAAALAVLKKSRAILVISHRPGLFAACDRVVELSSLQKNQGVPV